MKKTIVEGIIAIILIMLMGLTCIAAYIRSEMQYKKFIVDFKECEAVVTKVYKDYNRYNIYGLENVYIKYIVDDTEYNQKLSTNKGISFGGIITNFKVGDKTTIYYNPQNPKEIVTKESNKTGLFIAIYGLVTLIFGAAILIVVLRNYIKRKI